ncbi:MAG TPA: gamma-glutamyl-gamma-aminobutyrate hydrolase family protein [Clostridia bacterium]|nr:gamma-glutamyl-gamma-aminobutyrate hydrolase family protein [Clostridia bacterium]
MVPVIGITCHHDYSSNKLTVSKGYIHAVERCGGLPLLLPDVVSTDNVLGHCAVIDGLVLAGGVDVDPKFFGEQPTGTGEITPERDSYEITLVREFLTKDKPVLAICRGLQVLNICAGGDIYQDVNSQIERVIKHMQQAPKWYPTHNVSLKRGSKLQKIMGKFSTYVNSFHHQAPRRIAPGFEATAWAEDGIIEAIESTNHSFVLGVQWHPEQMFFQSSDQQALLRAFIRAAAERKNANGNRTY